MLAVRAKTNGMEIEFTEPLPEGNGWDPKQYTVKEWWYKPTPNYGGPKMDEESMTVKSATVSGSKSASAALVPGHFFSTTAHEMPD